MAAPQDWMPSGLTDAEKQSFADSYSDPHMAASVAWESWAGTLPPEGTVTSVSTGAQSITYAKGHSEFQAAMDRAAWHRSRAGAYSVNVGATYRYAWDHTHERDQRVYDSPPIPTTGVAQINLPSGRVGPRF